MEAIAKHLTSYPAKPNMPIPMISAVISDRSDSAGLGIAKDLGIPTSVVRRRPKELSQEEFFAHLLEEVLSHSPDLVVLAGFMRILPASFVSALKMRIINIHPSLLPAFKGLNPHQQALDAGVLFAGCTVHYVVEEMDAGPIIAQAVVRVDQSDNASTLAQRVLEQEHILYPRVITALAERNILYNSTTGKVSFLNESTNEQKAIFLRSL